MPTETPAFRLVKATLNLEDRPGSDFEAWIIDGWTAGRIEDADFDPEPWLNPDSGTAARQLWAEAIIAAHTPYGVTGWIDDDTPRLVRHLYDLTFHLVSGKEVGTRDLTLTDVRRIRNAVGTAVVEEIPTPSGVRYVNLAQVELLSVAHRTMRLS